MTGNQFLFSVPPVLRFLLTNTRMIIGFILNNVSYQDYTNHYETTYFENAKCLNGFKQLAALRHVQRHRQQMQITSQSLPRNAHRESATSQPTLAKRKTALMYASSDKHLRLRTKARGPDSISGDHFYLSLF